MAEKKEVKDRKTVVVNELPTQQFRTYTDEEGNEVDVITLNEAIEQMYNDIKAIKKAVA